jgi:hypothetical protein
MDAMGFREIKRIYVAGREREWVEAQENQNMRLVDENHPRR